MDTENKALRSEEVSKPQPVITAPGFTHAEVLQWVRDKLKATNELAEALECRESLELKLKDINARIELLIRQSELPIISQVEELTQHQAHHCQHKIEARDGVFSKTVFATPIKGGTQL